jgi:hypothetical protein
MDVIEQLSPQELMKLEVEVDFRALTLEPIGFMVEFQVGGPCHSSSFRPHR